MAKLRAGIIGTGFMGEAHLEALRRLPGVEVVAVAASRPEKAEAFSRAHRVPRAHADAMALLADPEVDVVHNCTPNHLHFVLNQAALQAGKHVMSEKPLALTSTETAALAELAERSGLVAAVNHCYRYYPLVQQARAMVQGGVLGRLYLVHGAYLQDWLLYRQDFNWRVDPARGGALRALGDIGSHWCDLAQYVTGRRITHVSGQLATVHATRLQPQAETATYRSADTCGASEVPVTTEDYAAALLRFEEGASGFFAVSQVSAGHKNGLSFEVDCAEGALRWHQEDPNVLWIGRRDRHSEIVTKDPALLDAQARAYVHYPAGHPEGYPDVFTNLFRNVYTHITDRSSPADFPTFREAHQVTRLLEAISLSHREGRWVEVPLD